MLVSFIQGRRSHVIGTIELSKEILRFLHTIHDNILKKKFFTFTKPVFRLCFTHFLRTTQSGSILTFIQIVPARYPINETSSPMLIYHLFNMSNPSKRNKKGLYSRSIFSKSTSLLKFENL